MSSTHKTVKQISNVNKEIREMVDPNQLPRLAKQMNDWINGDAMKDIHNKLKHHEKDGTCPEYSIMSKWSVQLATAVALSNGARPPIGAIMSIGDLTSVVENTHATTGRFYTIQLSKFNPFRAGTFTLGL